MADEPEPVADLGQDRLPVLASAAAAAPLAGSCRAGPPSTRNVMASMAIAIGAVRTWTRKPLIPKADELGGRSAGREGAVRLDEPLALDDRRQVGVVGRVEERRQDRRQRRSRRAAARSVRTPSDERDRDRAEQDGPPEVGPDEDRPPAEPVDPGAGDEPERRASRRGRGRAGSRPRSHPRRAPGSRRAATRSG